MEKFNLVPLLNFIHPDTSYETWVNVGMALKYEGYPLSIWEEWSRKGSKFHEGECKSKWKSFGHQDGRPVTGATITQLAKSNGWNGSEALDWNARLEDVDDLVIVDTASLDVDEFHQPSLEEWQPVEDAIRYLKALFHEDDHVGFVTKCFPREENGQTKYVPGNSGVFHLTCGELIEKLKKYRKIEDAFGTVDPKGGAWIRFNPLDGEGVRDRNVTDYRFALVESDSLELAKQVSILREMELPIAALVYSGGKSAHAIVHIDADTKDEYKSRVNKLYEICDKNGLKIDIQNKNASRLSRLPGVMRGDNKQFLIATNIGKSSYQEWFDWLQEEADNLPDFVNFGEALEEGLPPLAPELFEGLLRQGHKMLISGPSKAGKSFALIEMCIAIAEGGSWFGFPCKKQGKVLYVNLEIDEASCLDRFDKVYAALGMTPNHAGNIQIWNLRGESIPLEKLVPKLIRRIRKDEFVAIVIDPIYKVVVGDENSAGDMAKFCNQFDKICKSLGCSCIYCHHHSKGAQGNKRAMDRASGSGVFARDPDALLDMTPIMVEDEAYDGKTYFKVSGILREFPSFRPFSVTYEYPIHKIDTTGFLNMAALEGTAKGGRVKSIQIRAGKKTERQEQMKLFIEEELQAGRELTTGIIARKFNLKTTDTVNSDLKVIDPAGEVYFKDKKGRIIYAKNQVRN